MNHLLSKYLLYYPVTLLRGELIARHLESYEHFQWQTLDEIHYYQIEKLNQLLQYASSEIPYYKNKIPLEKGKLTSLDQLSSLPLLLKTDLTQHADDLTSGKQLFSSSKTTGGSTGQAVTVKKNPDALARERAATWRAYRWAGINIGDPQARFWGIPLQKKRRLLYQLADLAANRCRLSAFNISENTLHQYHTILHRFKPTYLYGYVSMIHEFILFLKQNRLILPSNTKAIITTSEILTDSIRSEIQNITNLNVFNEYGCGEVGSIAHECGHGKMHLMSDNLIVEILDDNNQPANSGELVVTDLFNYAMPLIRYKLGDFATLTDQPCTCGRGLPVIEKIHGRAYDTIITPNGNRFHPESIMYVFEEFKEAHGSIRQFQLVQTVLDTLEIHIIKTPDIIDNALIEQKIPQRINQILGYPFNYHFFYPNIIPREKSGKLRIVKSLLQNRN